MSDMSEQISESAAEVQAEEWQTEAEVEAQQKPVPGHSQAVYQQERGGVAWCELYGKTRDEAGQVHLVKINVTNRGNDAEDALRGLLHALAVAKEEFHMTPFMPEFSNAPQTRPAANPVPALAVPAPVPGQPVIPPPPAVQVPAPAPVPAQQVPAQAAPQVMKIVKLEVKPRTDGKVDVALFGEGRKYADLHMIGTPEQISQKFGGAWTPAHFGPNLTTAYNVVLQVTWANSDRLNSNGVPYKNVVSVA